MNAFWNKKIAISLLISLLLISSISAIFFTKYAESKKDVLQNGLNQEFSRTINGKSYQMEYITKDYIEKTKSTIKEMEHFDCSNTNSNGIGTGLTTPTDKEIEALEGKLLIKDYKPTSSDIPPEATYDFSNQIYFPEVRSQGGQGSCASWAITYYAYGYLEAKDNGWDASSGNNDYLMSPAWTFNKVSLDNGGSWMTTNAQIMLDFGCATLSTMPYDDSDYYSWGDEAAWREAPYHRPYDYSLMDFDELDPTSTIAAIKSFISSETPVTFAFDSGEYSSGFGDGNYILSSDEYSSLTYDHAQCIVGYDDSITDDGDVGAFKVVNSWGTGFGDSGYYWMTYDCLTEIGFSIGDFCLHLCVLTDRIDYEPVLIATWEFETAPTRMDEMITLGVGSHASPLATITPWYEYDNTYALPSFMAYDISEFYSYYTANNDVTFFLEIGFSAIAGNISSFLIERYVSGALTETSSESIDVPQITPGYVVNTFMNLDHEIGVSLELPDNPVVSETYLINATVENFGQNTESNVELNLYLDSALVNTTTISSLSVGMSETIDYYWTPIIYNTYNFTVYAPPVVGECIPDNNYIESLLPIYLLQNYTMTPGYTYSWIDASGGTELFLDDDDYETLTLPFEFDFYNQKSLTEVFLSSNGYLSFYDTTADEYTNVPFPSATPMHYYMIAPFWDDIFPQFGGHIYIQNFSDCWVAQWQDVPYTYPNLDTGSFQVILYKNGDIIFNYDYFSAAFTSTCGLNLGIDSRYYSMYEGLTSSTNDFSIRFNSSSLPGGYHLSSSAGSPDIDGNFALTWDASVEADNYSVFEYSGFITEINGSLTLLADEITQLSLAIYGYSNGIYYFIVVASNDMGDTLSNCIQIEVTIPSPPLPGSFTLSSDSDSPDDDGIFSLTWGASTEATNYSVYMHLDFITEINGSVTQLAGDITDLYLSLDGYESGDYYFIVVAHNDNGETLSNCIHISVELSRRIPGYNMIILLLTMVGITSLLIKSKKFVLLKKII
jgi:C1A family cysteine protease